MIILIYKQWHKKKQEEIPLLFQLLLNSYNTAKI